MSKSKFIIRSNAYDYKMINPKDIGLYSQISRRFICKQNIKKKQNG